MNCFKESDDDDEEDENENTEDEIVKDMVKSAERRNAPQGHSTHQTSSLSASESESSESLHLTEDNKDIKERHVRGHYAPSSSASSESLHLTDEDEDEDYALSASADSPKLMAYRRVGQGRRFL